MMRKRILLLIWILGILFPTAWIGRYSPGFSQLYEAVFSPEWVHWVMHAGLYAGFTILIIYAFDLRSKRKVLGWVLLITLGVGVVQESLQQITSNIPYLRWNSLLDLGVDLGGTLIGFGAAAVIKWYRRTY